MVYLPLNLTPISPTFYKEYSDKFLNEKFVGTGKYMLTSFSNEVQSIDPNLNYWGDKPSNKGINLWDIQIHLLFLGH